MFKSRFSLYAGLFAAACFIGGEAHAQSSTHGSDTTHGSATAEKTAAPQLSGIEEQESDTKMAAEEGFESLLDSSEPK